MRDACPTPRRSNGHGYGEYMLSSDQLHPFEFGSLDVDWVLDLEAGLWSVMVDDVD